MLLYDIMQMLCDECFYAMTAKYIITYTHELIPFIVRNIKVFYKNIEGRKNILLSFSLQFLSPFSFLPQIISITKNYYY